MADNPMLSRSHEDYLRVVYNLEARFGVAQTSAIAEGLDLAPASVSRMVKRLAELGLVEHALHRGVRLTDSGCQAALQVLRRHRIIEAYLVEKLEYEWDSVDAEADRLEHAVSDELVETMARAMGNPRYERRSALFRFDLRSSASFRGSYLVVISSLIDKQRQLGPAWSPRSGTLVDLDFSVCL